MAMPAHARLPALLLPLLLSASTAPSFAEGVAAATQAEFAATPRPPDAAPAPSPREEFAATCQAMREGDFPWYGERELRALEAELAALGNGTGDDDGDDKEEVRLRSQLGVELLKHNRPADAVASLSRALALIDARDPEDPARWGTVWFLGLANLQLAEDENCIERHNESSCILPLRLEGVHSRPEAARRAGDLFLQVVAHEPSHIQAAWLASLSRMLSGDYPQGTPEGVRPPAAALAPEADFPRWVDRAAELGVNAFDHAGGAVMDDFDGDGLLDLVTTTWDPCGGMKAFRNDGKGGFEEVAGAWRLDDQLGGLNLSHADYDNDGDLDLLVLRGGWMLGWGRTRNSLLRNDLARGGGFVDVTRQAGLADPAYPTQAGVWADYDGDGDLDLYLGNEVAGHDQPHPSQLFENQGDGTFVDVAPRAGVTNDRYAKAAAWGDYDNDGDPDLYVSNLGPNRLYRNDGDGTFTDVAPQLGVTRPTGRSFTTWFFDADNDGDLDLLVADYGADLPVITASYYGFPSVDGQPLLYRNDGGRFIEVSREVGITRPTLPMGGNYGDLDNDGWLDFYLGTGDPRYEAVMPNVAYRNLGGRFAEVTFASGLGHLQKGHGVAFGDLDGDGDQDLFHQLGGFYPGDAFANALFENPGPPRHWITLRLVGVKANRFGVGARIEARIREGEGSRSIHLLAGSGGSFGSSSLQQEMGLGDADELVELTVRWPGSGTVDRIRGAALDRTYRLVEGSGRLEPVEVPHFRLGAGPTSPPAHHHGGR